MHKKFTDSVLNTFFRKFIYQTIGVFCIGNCLFLVTDPNLILAGVPENLGLKNQMLSPCPVTPNCVSSQEKNSNKRIQPIIIEDSIEQAKERIYKVINSMRGTRIITQEDFYWHVEFTTQPLRFIDDVEFYFEGSQLLIHLRSASRRGYWDLGVNRRRIGTIRSKFEKLTNDND